MRKNSLFLYCLLLYGCDQGISEGPLFEEISTDIGISFVNNLNPTEAFNPYTFRSYYNGGGVAIGDVDNNGYQDVYFTGNQVDNKLYLNFGNWNFKEIALKAGVACDSTWSTGATFADVNQDGWVDLYVCKSGAPGGKDRANSLFINNKDGTFTDRAEEYGLAVEGLSVQAAFFDYDKDGDLDCYLLTNSFRSIGTGADLKKNTRHIPDKDGNKLFRNDNGSFTDVSEWANIYTSAIGFGLGITLGDVNYDGWPDFFISNDFFEKDYLYINNQDGTFSEQGERYFSSMSLGSMGADIADIDNDGYLDLVVTEMLPEPLDRKKTKAMFESWNKHELAVSNGYFYQYPRNMLQHGISDGHFSEVGRLAGIANTEWSWGALLFDMDNDGLKDLFISNGIGKDLLDRDFLSFTASKGNIQKLIYSGRNAILELLGKMPEKPVLNAVYNNKGGLSFSKVSSEWGFGQPSFSNGSAYVDLDNDNDLDLVVNNVNQEAFVYRNNSSEKGISIRLIDEKGGQGIGVKITVHCGETSWIYENYPVKGYQSASTPIAHFGLGKRDSIDSLKVDWPSGKQSRLYSVKTNELIVIEEKLAEYHSVGQGDEKKKPVFRRSSSPIHFVHKENDFVDFDRNALLPEMYSNLGAKVATGDVNGDSKYDFYFGGAKGQSGELLLSASAGYEKIMFEEQALSEDITSIFFDADQDGDLDLYVASGGAAFGKESKALCDRLYLNLNGKFLFSEASIPYQFKVSTSFVAPADFDFDGDIDLLVGERFDPQNYGIGGGLHLLENIGEATFVLSEKHTFPEIKNTHLITDGKWVDLNQDGQLDIVAIGEWSPIHLFIFDGTHFQYATDKYGLSETCGWWNTLEVEDLNKDGRLDMVIGNKGSNSFFKKGTRLHTADFDRNGFIDNIISVKEYGRYYPIHDKDEIIPHFPILKKRSIYYHEYASKTTEDLFGKELLDNALVSEIDIAESCIFYATKDGFVQENLPLSTQLSPIYAIELLDINKDGWTDAIVGGNQYKVKPQFGRYDALNVTIAFGSAHGYTDDFTETSDIKGQVRDIKYFKDDKEKILFFVNDDSIQVRDIYW